MEIEIKNSGPVESLSVPVPEGGGIVVIRGENGRGKTMALDAIALLVGGDGRLSPRDGESFAEIKGLGLRVRGGKRTTKKGELETRPSTSGRDPSVLVDPGIKDPVAADSARVRALLRLAGIELSPDSFRHLVHGLAVDLDRFDGESDPTKLAAAIKREFEAHARETELETTEAKARADGLFLAASQTLGSDPTDVLASDPPEIDRLDATEKAIAERVVDLRYRREAWLRAEEARQKATAELEQIESGGGGDSADALAKQLDEARSLEVDLQNRLAGVRATIKQLEQRHAESERRAKRVEALRAAIENSAEEVTAEDLSIAEDQSLAAAKSAATGKKILTARMQMLERGKALEAQTSAEFRAGELRTAAAGVDGVLTAAATAFAGDDWRYHDHRLQIKHPGRGWIPFADLSAGEAYTRSLEIAMLAEGRGALFAVRQEAWEGLDPHNRARLAEEARRIGVTLVTAEATDGPIRAEVFSA
jgi:hypothetical protein